MNFKKVYNLVLISTEKVPKFLDRKPVVNSEGGIVTIENKFNMNKKMAMYDYNNYSQVQGPINTYNWVWQ